MLWWEKLAYNANTVRTGWKQRSLLKETWPALKGESDPEAAGLSGLLDRVKVSCKAVKATFMLVELGGKNRRWHATCFDLRVQRKEELMVKIMWDNVKTVMHRYEYSCGLKCLVCITAYCCFFFLDYWLSSLKSTECTHCSEHACSLMLISSVHSTIIISTTAAWGEEIFWKPSKSSASKSVCGRCKMLCVCLFCLGEH